MTTANIDQARLAANWRAITAELDAPRPVRVERMLLALRLPPHVVRMIVATPALRRSWYLSILAVVLVGLGGAEPDRPDSLFALLVLAPMLPVLGVAMAYGTTADPSHEIQLATPTRGLRVIAIRATTVLVVSIVIVGSLSLLSPAARPMAAAWLLPALAVTSSSLAMMTLRPPRQATLIVAVAWFAAVITAQVGGDDQLAAFRAGGQIVSFAVAIVACIVIITRRNSYEQMELAW
jgi:hypothetical protein